MSHGSLSPAQRQMVQAHVSGKTVHDVGAGDLLLAKSLLNLGAAHVIALEKERMPARIKGITPVRGSFHEYREPIQTAFVSWPVNWWDKGLLNLIERSEVVLYLGSNLDGLMCGFQRMWEHLSEREVLGHVPDRANTLIVYGPNSEVRKPLPEEFAALNLERIWSYQELHPQ